MFRSNQCLLFDDRHGHKTELELFNTAIRELLALESPGGGENVHFGHSRDQFPTVKIILEGMELNLCSFGVLVFVDSTHSFVVGGVVFRVGGSFGGVG